MAFDPDEFLAQPASTGFDPDAYLNGNQNPEETIFGKRPAGALEGAISPVTGFLPTQQKISTEGMKTAEEGTNQIYNMGALKALKGAAVAGLAPIAPGLAASTPEAREVGKGLGKIGLGAAQYLGSWPAAAFHEVVGRPIGRDVAAVTGSPKTGEFVGNAAEIGAGFMLPTRLPRLPEKPPVPLPEEPFGVPLSEGELTGDLPTRGREQAAIVGRSGEPAYKHGKAWAEERDTQLEAAKNQATAALHPTGEIIANTPDDAGQVISAEVRRREAERNQTLTEEGENLRPQTDELTHPHDAAETVADTLRGTAENRTAAQETEAARLEREFETQRAALAPNNQMLARSPQEAADIISAGVTRAEEQATAVRDTAYDRYSAMPGTFKPQVYSNVENDVRRALNNPNDPVIINDKTTPMANQVLGELDRTLGEPARIASDPNTASFKPFTPRSIDDVRKRIVAYERQAWNTARATNDYSDVRAIGRIGDAFDDIVASALRKKGTFSGDGRAVAAAQAEARGAHADLRRTFYPQGKGDVVGPVMSKIIGQREGQAMPANEIAGVTAGNGPKPVLVGRRLQSVFGPNSMEIGALKQGILSDRVGSVAELGPAKVIDNIDDFINGSGRELSRLHFTPQELSRLQQYASDLRSTIPSRRPATDIVGSTIEKVNGVGGQPLTNAEFSEMLFGKSGIGENPNGVKMAQHVKDTYGDKSDAFLAMQRGQIATLVRATEGRAGFDHADIAQRIRDFLDGRGKSMADTLFTPEQQGIMRDYANRLDNYAQRAAPTKDPVEKAIARITGSDGGPPATPREVASMLVNRSSPTDKATSLALIRRMKAIMLPEQFAAIKQMAFRQMIEPGPAENLREWGSQRVVNSIADFKNKAPEIFKEIFTPSDQEMVNRFQRLHDRIAVPTSAIQNWNKPFLTKVANAISNTASTVIGTIIGATVGHTTGAHLAGEGAAIIAANATSKIREKLADVREAKEVAKLLPLAGERFKQYQKAVAAAQRSGLPQYEARALMAGSALSDSLKPLGIDFNKLSIEGPGTAIGEEKKKEIPRPENKKDNGATINQPHRVFAHGGRVGDSHPHVAGARLAPDGDYYLIDKNRPGKYLKVVHRGRTEPAAAAA